MRGRLRENVRVSGIYYVVSPLIISSVDLTAEEIREKRRAERKQFKLDRAAAIAAVAEEAEEIFSLEGRVVQPALSGPAIPSAATWRPSTQYPPEELVDVEDGPLEDDAPLVDVEHLQLTLQEAFVLLGNLDCLTVLDPEAVSGDMLRCKSSSLLK